MLLAASNARSSSAYLLAKGASRNVVEEAEPFLNFERRVGRRRSRPFTHRPVIQWRVIGKRAVRNVRQQLAVVQNAQPGFCNHSPHNHRVQPPFGEDTQDLGGAILSATSNIRSWLSLSMIS